MQRLNCVTIVMCLIILVFAGAASAEKVWTSFTASDAVYDIALDGDYVWCATANGPVRWDRRDMSYTVCNGIHDNRVRHVVIDAKGAVWFGGFTGVHKWDGVSWRQFNKTNELPYSEVTSIAAGPDGDMWVATYVEPTTFSSYPKAVSRYIDDTWNIVQNINYLSEEKELRLGPTSSFVIWSSSDAWMIQGNNLRHYDGTSWITVVPGEGAPTNTVSQMAADSASGLFVAENYAVYRYSAGIWERIYTAGNWVTAMTTGPKGALIISVSSGDVTILHPHETGWEAVPVGRGDSYEVKALECDGDGVIWAATDRGLYRYDDRGWTRYVIHDRLPFSNITHLAPDMSGGVWAGSPNGALRFDGRSWKKYSIADGLPDSTIISMVSTPDGSVWFGTKKGIARFDGKSWTRYGVGQGLSPSAEVKSMMKDTTGNPWVRTESGIYRFDGGIWTPYPLGQLATTDFTVWTVDASETVWAGVYPERWEIRSPTKTIHFKDNGNNANGWGYCIFMLSKPDGETVIGTNYPAGTAHHPSWKGFLFSFKDSTVNQYYSYTGRFSSACFGPDNMLLMGFEPDRFYETGQVFGGGLYINATGYFEQNGLLSKHVTAVTATPDGAAWASTLPYYSNSLPGICRYGEPFGQIISRTDDERPISRNMLFNHPNPFNPSTTIAFSLAVSGKTVLSIYSVTGQRVHTMVLGNLHAGEHSVVWDGTDDSGRRVSAGVYLSRLQTGRVVRTGKMLLIK